MVLFYIILIIFGLFALNLQEDFLGHKRNTIQYCDNLNFLNCLQVERCGWLADRGGRNGKCLPGTEVGPLNPKLWPNAEDGNSRNIQFDRWIYNHPNPFIFG